MKHLVSIVIGVFILVSTFTKAHGGNVPAEVSLWPNGIISWKLSDDIPIDIERLIRKSIEEWNTRTVIWFKELKSNEELKDYVLFECPRILTISAIGKRGEMQQIWLEENVNKQAIVHELGHTIGLLHEHQREDRDKHIKILLNEDEKKNPRFLETFMKIKGIPIGDYDYASVMHYSYGIQGIGDRPIGGEIPSQGDIETVRRMYAKYF